MVADLSFADWVLIALLSLAVGVFVALWWLGEEGE